MKTKGEEINFECPHCGETIEAPSSMAGESSQCPGCGGAIEVPELDDSANEIRFNCPQCKQKLAAPFHMVGEQSQCPACEGTFTIPAESTRPRKAPNREVPRQKLQGLTPVGCRSSKQTKRKPTLWQRLRNRGEKWRSNAQKRKEETRAEREEYLRTHLRCPGCSNYIPNSVQQCPLCDAPFRDKGAFEVWQIREEVVSLRRQVTNNQTSGCGWIIIIAVAIVIALVAASLL